MIEYVVMGMILHKPLTGYDIKKEIDAGLGNFYKSSYGNLYPSLKKLTEKGYLSLTEQTQVDRLKKYYKTTELGRNEFLKWLSSPVDINLGTAMMMLRIYFIGELPKDIRSQIIQEYKIAIQNMFDEYKKIEAQLKNSIKNDRDYFEISTLYYGLQTAQGMLHWLEHIKEQKSFDEFIKEEY